MTDLNDLFKVIAEGKKEYEETDPVGIKLKQVKENVKVDLSSLFSQLTSLKEDLEKELIVAEAKQEQAPMITEEIPAQPIIHTPEVRAAQVNADVNKYLTDKSFQQPNPDLVDKNVEDIRNKIKFLEQAIGKIASAGPGSGEVNLRWLDDIDRSSIGDNKYLRYNATSKKFEFVTLSGGGVDVDTLDSVTTRGNTTENDITVGSATGDYFQVNTTATPTITTGMIAWNPDVNTFNMGLLNDVVLQVGQETHMYVKANEAISNGQAVMFAGATGEHILVRKYDPTVSGFISEWFIGVATQNFTTNEFGYVTLYGLVHDVNTNAYSVGNILYANNDVPGGLTTSTPAPGKPHIIVAAVTKKSGTGHIMVRPTIRPTLADLPDVVITSPQQDQTLKYNSTLNAWVNSTGGSGASGATGPTGATGLSGATGSAGSNGSTGATGSTGPQGIQGASGSTGISGATGSTGQTGATGTAGSNGINGASGATGETGATGIQGPAGASGVGGTGTGDGATGSTGPTGATGIAGINGATGSTGPTGATGTAGINGSTGPQGIQGASGATGTAGTNGTNGATGATGVQGASGLQGASGSTGIIGASGIQGASGPTSIPQNSQSTGYTLQLTDAGEHIYLTATNTITIPANNVTSFPVGTVISIITNATATATIAINTDTLYLGGVGTTGSRSLSPYGLATLIKVTSTSWYISGAGVS